MDPKIKGLVTFPIRSYWIENRGDCVLSVEGHLDHSTSAPLNNLVECEENKENIEGDAVEDYSDVEGACTALSLCSMKKEKEEEP